MTEILETIVMFFHNLAMATWIGGMIFLSFLSFEVEKLGPQFNPVLGKMSKVFSKLAMLSIIVLLVTGVLLTYWHGGFPRWQRDLVLNLKHFVILLVIINGAILSTRIVPNLEKSSSQKSPEAKVWQKKLKLHSKINLILGIIIVLLATA